MLSCQDADIFTCYKEWFAKENGRQRRTSSAGAVKKRRQRLVKAGNVIFGVEQPKTVSQPREGAGTVQRAFRGMVGR